MATKFKTGDVVYLPCRPSWFVNHIPWENYFQNQTECMISSSDDEYYHFVNTPTKIKIELAEGPEGFIVYKTAKTISNSDPEKVNNILSELVKALESLEGLEESLDAAKEYLDGI